VPFAIGKESDAFAIPVHNECGSLGLQEQQRAGRVGSQIRRAGESRRVIQVPRVNQAGDQQPATAFGRAPGMRSVEQTDGETVLVDRDQDAAPIEISRGEVSHSLAGGGTRTRRDAARGLLIAVAEQVVAIGPMKPTHGTHYAASWARVRRWRVSCSGSRIRQVETPSAVPILCS